MKNEKISGLGVFAVVVTLMVVAVVAVGIYEAGSPSTQRAKTLDQRRVDALTQISYAVNSYYQAQHALPDNLQMLTALGQTYYAVSSINDPETGTPFEYRVVDPTTFELCATFNFPSDAANGGPYPQPQPVTSPVMPMSQMNWYQHAAGHVCEQQAVTAPPVVK